MSAQSAFNVFLKTAGAYDSDMLSKPAADCGTVNTQCVTLHILKLVTLELQLKQHKRALQQHLCCIYFENVAYYDLNTEHWDLFVMD